MSTILLCFTKESVIHLIYKTKLQLLSAIFVLNFVYTCVIYGLLVS